MAGSRKIPTPHLSFARRSPAFFALRWWKIADRLRAHRFSLVPILAAGFWAVVLLVLWPHAESPRGAVALVLTAVIVQWVSPWEAPPLPAVKRMRLRHA